MTPEEMQRAMVEAADRVNWLLAVRGRAMSNYSDDTSIGDTDDVFWQAREDSKELVAYVDKLRDYLKEKNELIKAYAGPTGMTPEDVAYGLADWRPRAEAAEAEVIRLNALLEEIRAEKIER